VQNYGYAGCSEYVYVYVYVYVYSEGYKIIAENLCSSCDEQRPQLTYFSLFPYKRQKESPLDLKIVRKSSWINGEKKPLFR
jgi:hypothetical protein